jgi:hypothetical protein
MLVPESACLRVPKQILLELEDIVLGITFRFKTLWDGHVELTFHLCLSVGQHNINCLVYQAWIKVVMSTILMAAQDATGENVFQ